VCRTHSVKKLMGYINLIQREIEVFSLGFCFSSPPLDCRHSWGGEMAVAIPPLHVPFAPGSSYLLDVLVLVPLPFLFLSPASSLYGDLFHLFLGLFVPLFGSSGFRRFTALRLRQVFYAPPPRHSLIATFLSGVPARSRLSLLRLIILLFILCFLWFTYILFPLFIFCFAGFPCICFSISLYCFFLFVLCVF
jgi:hypothetical protein